MAVAEITGDLGHMVTSQSCPVRRFEIVELQEFLEKRKCFSELRAAVEYAKGDLGEHLKMFNKLGVIAKEDPDNKVMDRLLSQCFPQDVRWERLMAYTHLEIVSDSTTDFKKTKAKKFPWQYVLEASFPTL